MTLTYLAASAPLHRGLFRRRRLSAGRGWLLPAALFLAVLLVEAMLIATAAPTVADLSSLSITVN